nr:hypothetical protein [Ochrobactrum sp. CM-21-5]
MAFPAPSIRPCCEALQCGKSNLIVASTDDKGKERVKVIWNLKTLSLNVRAGRYRALQLQGKPMTNRNRTAMRIPRAGYDRMRHALVISLGALLGTASTASAEQMSATAILPEI